MSAVAVAVNDADDVYLESKEVAERLGVSIQTLRHWRYTGLRDELLPYKTRIDRRVIYKESTVEHFKKRRRQKLSATPDLSCTVSPCLTTNSVSKNAPTSRSVCCAA